MRAKRQFDFVRQRRNEIATLVKHRHGRLPDTDDAILYIEAAARHLTGKDRPFKVEQWCRLVGRLPTSAELTRAVAIRPRSVKAETLGRWLRLTYAERAALRITTIGAWDVDPEERKRRKRDRERERQRAKRRAAGRLTRIEYRTKSLTAKKPWEAQGVSRRTYYRRLGPKAVAQV